MKLMQSKFKDDKMEPPDNYLGASITKLDDVHGNSFWAMSSDQYCSALVKNVKDKLQTKNMRLPSKCPSPFSHGYKPEMDSCRTETNRCAMIPRS